MDAKTYLKEYANRADIFLDKYFSKKIDEVGEIGKRNKGTSIAVDMLTRYRKFSFGGKKLRGALIQVGYEIGGKNKKEVLQASLSIEIIHSFLLMHDDIEDKDSIRRGAPTIHKQYEAKRNDPHYGISMGINTGDLGAYLGIELLLNSKLPEREKVKAGIYLSHLLQRVAYGQGLDTTYEQIKNIKESDVIEVHLHKTSVYTVGGPLKIGALLAGANNEVVKNIEKFGEPVGIAFQLRDDELGLFSNEETLGKPIGGDIREGKNTILRIKAVELAKGNDKNFLVWAYGNQNITKKDVKRVQTITVSVGALEYSQNLGRELVEKGKKYISKITKNKIHQDLLKDFAELVISRDN
jgi:geranylgeranyl diphosphate synthase, type I